MFSNRALVSLIIPLVIEQFLAILIGMVGMAMVSNISEAAVSSISLVDSINILFVQFFSAMGTGGAVVAAQYLGKREPLNACKAGKQLLYVSLLIALFFSIFTFIFCDFILHLFFGDLNPTTLQYSRTYFYFSALSYPALAIYNGGAALLRAMGDSKSSMFTSLIMNILNIASNALLIYVLQLEVAGAGISLLLSRILGAVMIFRLLLNPIGRIHLIRPFHFEPNKDMIRRIFTIAIPNGLENSMFQIGKLLVAGIVASYSVSIIAANAVASNISSLFNLPGSAIGLAIVTVIGQCMGAGDTKQAQHYSMKLLKLVYIFMFFANTVLFFTARPLALVFNLSPAAVDAAVEVLEFFAISATIFWPSSFTLPTILRAAGDGKFTMLVSVLSMWIFRIALSYLLAYTFDLKLLGVWIAMAVDWVARSVCFGWRYHSGQWLKKKIV